MTARKMMGLLCFAFFMQSTHGVEMVYTIHCA